MMMMIIILIINFLYRTFRAKIIAKNASHS